jgi:hypothetical protein
MKIEVIKTLLNTQLKINTRMAWWYTPVIPALGRLRQKDLEFKARRCYIVGPCL